jgi:antitoxin MazE
MDIQCINLSMKVTTQSWGNSLGLRIPAPIARETNLTQGSEVDLKVEKGCIVLTPLRRRRRHELRSLVAGITPENTPSGDPWGAPMGREIW